jgi:Gpi18-like mannosyltransferase
MVVVYIFLILLIFIPTHSYKFDQYCFHSWCTYIFQHGLTNAYHNAAPDFNYPPLIGYVYYLFGKLVGSQQNIDKYFYLLKAFALCFDFISAIVIVNLLGDNKWKTFWFLILAANPFFIYNTYFWGQYDAVLSGFILLSFVFLMKKNLTLGLLFFLLAINFKTQAIVFFPPLSLLAIYQFWQKTKPLELIRAVGICVVVQLIIFLPFILTGEMGGIVRAYTGSVNYYSEISKTAYNIWALLLGDSAFTRADTELWLSISMKVWGLLMFCTASFFAMLPLLYSFISKAFLKNKVEISKNSLFIVFALIPLLFFFLNTQMHERYSHPAFVFVALFTFATRNYFLLAIMCVAYFGNLEPGCCSFNLPNYKIMIFHPAFVATAYLTLITALFYYLYTAFITSLKSQNT